MPMIGAMWKTKYENFVSLIPSCDCFCYATINFSRIFHRSIHRCMHPEIQPMNQKYSLTMNKFFRML
jgi:hypothetical protein